MRGRPESTSFETSQFVLSQKLDPKTLLPPQSLSVRDKASKLSKDLKYPCSPAFVSIYKMSRDTVLPQATDYAQKQNIPFNSEEHNYYRSRQNKSRFRQYTHTMNQCFETSRPDDFTTGYNLLSDKEPRPPPEKTTSEFTDGQLYVPNIFQVKNCTKDQEFNVNLDLKQVGSKN